MSLKTITYKLGLLLFLTAGLTATAQNVWLHGSLADHSPSIHPEKVYLLRSAPLRSEDLLDSAVVAPTGEFTFQAAPYSSAAVYHLQLTGGTPLSVMTTGTDRIVITANATDFFYGKCQVSGSKEHVVFEQLELIWEKNMDAQRTLGEAYDKVDFFDPKYDTKTNALREAFEWQIQTSNLQVRQLQADHKGTFAADELAQLYIYQLKQEDPTADTTYDNNLAFQHQSYFNGIDLNNSNIVAYDRYYDRLDDYFANYVDATSAKGMKKAIDKLMSRISAPDTRSLIALYLSERFRDIKQFELTEHVLANYFERECSFSSSDVWNKKADGLKALQIGSMAPEIALPTMEGKRLKLSSLKGKKAIVLYFWSSRCQYCTDALGEIMDFHSRNAPLGLEIYAVSLEESHERWSNYLTQTKPRWVNVFDEQGTSGQYARTYGLRGTPTYILLDSDMRIELRTHDLHELFVNINGLLAR